MNNLKPVTARDRATHMIARTDKPHIQFIPTRTGAMFRGMLIHGYVLMETDRDEGPTTLTRIRVTYAATIPDLIVKANGYGK
jgi:hypothetical protein